MPSNSENNETSLVAVLMVSRRTAYKIIRARRRRYVNCVSHRKELLFVRRSVANECRHFDAFAVISYAQFRIECAECIFIYSNRDYATASK